MMDLELLTAKVRAVRSRMEEAARRSGRVGGGVQLLAVTKTMPVEVLEMAVRAGLGSLGENRVQELEEKVPRLDRDLDWHLIGPLQKNKARRALALAGTIHSVDSVELARRLDRLAEETGRRPRVYWQVNVGREASKAGFEEEELRRGAEELISLRNLEVLGLMTIPPPVEDPEEARGYFVGLRELRDALERITGRKLPGLSMGMSHDFEVAIEEGATVVRVGSALFGERG